jgi:hypothetical protein
MQACETVSKTESLIRFAPEKNTRTCVAQARIPNETTPSLLSSQQRLKRFRRGQFLAIREHNLLQKRDLRANLVRIDEQDYLIPGLQCFLGPPDPVQHGRVCCFGNPMFHVALVIRDVVVNLRMRIAVLKFRDRRFHGDRFRHVVSGIPVVREQRRGTHQEKANHDKKNRLPALHATPHERKYWILRNPVPADKASAWRKFA